MNPQTEQYLREKTVKEAEIKALKSQIIRYCEEKMKELDYKGLTECQYCEMKSRIDTLEEVINYVNNL